MTTNRKLHLKRSRTESNFIDLIQSHSICQMLAIFWVESERTVSEFGKEIFVLRSTYSIKRAREIRKFHVAVVQRRSEVYKKECYTIAWENSRHLATLPLVSPPNDVWETSAEIPYWWHVTSQIWVVLLIGWINFSRGTTNQKHYPDLGSDASSVWNFCARFSNVILLVNQW